jgi:hypothetical protein
MGIVSVSKRLALVVLAALLGGGVAWLGIRWWSRAAEVELADLPSPPPGRWHVLPRGGAISEREDEIARLLSLPYVAGRHEAESRVGVVVHDTTRTSDGLNLYVSGHEPEALLIDMDGRLLHRWRLSFQEAFGGAKPSFYTGYWRRAHLLPDGALLAIFQAGGMVKLDFDSNLLWVVDEGFYNDLEVTDHGTILAIGKAARVVPAINPDEPVLEDFIVELSPDGRIIGRLSLLQSIVDSRFAELLQPMADQGDIFHTNTVEWLDGRLASVSSLYSRENLLVSFREVDIVGIIDPRREELLWAARGPWDAQHQPTLLDDGSVLIFDNRGADGLARVVEFDVPRGEIAWEYAGPADAPLTSNEAGSCQRLPNGNTLITESERGRAIEVTRDGEVVWEFLSPHRAGPQQNLVATLFDVVRLPRREAPFLTDRGSGKKGKKGDGKKGGKKGGEKG